MKKTFFKILLSIITMQLVVNTALALELDMSVDEEIRKKYDSSKLENTVLPPLPKIDNSQNKTIPINNTTTTTTTKQTTSIPKVTPTYTTEVRPQITPADKKGAIKIFRWTTFETKSNQKINNWLSVGSSVSFTTTAPVYKKNITIPTGTIFKGTITDVHKPQATGNGGLVVIKITSMTFNGKTYPVNAKITKANAKNIYLNNIKGQRQYWANAGKQVDKGEAFYQRAKKTSTKLANNPIGIIISPIPTIVGVAGYTVNTAISPITSIFAKGGNVSIPTGSSFEIRLNESAYIY
ncbi:hypothetical protein EGQ77_08870 [bacterium]|nr:hypothetical protein [bacterium]